MSTQANPLQALAQAQAANRLANDLIRAQAIEMQTQLPPIGLSATVNNAGAQVNILPRNVGLLKGFFIEYNATIKNNNATAALNVLSPMGSMNFLSNVMFTDLQNNVRINCPGYQLALLNTVKNRAPAGYALKPGSYTGSAWWSDAAATVQGQTTPQVDTAWYISSPIAAGGTGVVTGVIHVPISYSDHDYRGAIYSNVINGQMALQLTINPRPAFLTGKSAMLALSGPADSEGSVQILNTQITVTQVYMDQLPIDPKSGLPILPQRDISTIYELKNTTFTGAVPGNDFPMQYPNFRDVLSSIVLFDNPSVGPPDTGVVGWPNYTPQIANYFALQAANSTNIFRRTPNLNCVLTRSIIGTDFPTGSSYFSYRGKPLSTTQYGNLQLIFNPTAKWQQSSAIYHCWESFASIATISQAGSLAAGS